MDELFVVNGQLADNYSASGTQRLIALSPAEGEYHSAVSCAIDGLLIRAMVEHLFPNETAPLWLFLLASGSPL